MKTGEKVLPRVFNFSGGQSSAYMTLKHYRENDLVIFTDTAREHPKTYEFIDQFEKHEGIPIIRLKWRNEENAFRALLESRDYKILPNRLHRFCTDELKVRTVKRYLKSIGIREYQNYLGFRLDEPLRVARRRERYRYKKVHDRFPLFEDGITKEMVDAFWKTKPYRLEIPRVLGNCTLCPLKGQNAILRILSNYPELADEWVRDEDEAFARHGRRITYFQGISIRELRDMAQMNLFSNADMNAVESAFNCACTA